MKHPVEAIISTIDSELYAIVDGINILDAVKPLNYLQEKEKFFANNFSTGPSFTYKTTDVDTFSLKRRLYNLPLEKIQDEDLYKLYLAVIDSYADKIDQYKSIGTNEFLYDSLRYYGEPNEKDINNAQFILHLPSNPNDKAGELVDAQGIVKILSKMAEAENYTWEVKLDETMVANALVSGTTVRINSSP
jgi:hypothetical protein